MQHIVTKYMSVSCRENSDTHSWHRVPEDDLAAASRRELRREERERAQERSWVDARIRTRPEEKEAALEVLRPYARQIEYSPLHHTLQVRLIGDAEKRARIKEALFSLGSKGCGESGHSGGMVMATGSIINRLVVAEQIRAGGIEFDGMPPLPKTEETSLETAQDVPLSHVQRAANVPKGGGRALGNSDSKDRPVYGEDLED